MAGLTEAEDISDIAFAYMGSKALFAAIKFDIFTVLAEGPLYAETLADKVGLPPERCRTLMTALTVLDLTTVDDAGRFANSPAADAFLVKGAKYDFSDYLDRQVGQQVQHGRSRRLARVVHHPFTAGGHRPGSPGT